MNTNTVPQVDKISIMKKNVVTRILFWLVKEANIYWQTRVYMHIHTHMYTALDQFDGDSYVLHKHNIYPKLSF